MPPPVPAARAGEEVASSRRPSVEPRKITLKGAPTARRTRWREAPPLTVIFHGSPGAYRKDGPGWTLPVAACAAGPGGLGFENRV